MGRFENKVQYYRYYVDNLSPERRKYAEVKKSYTDYLIERLRQGEDI